MSRVKSVFDCFNRCKAQAFRELVQYKHLRSTELKLFKPFLHLRVQVIVVLRMHPMHAPCTVKILF